MGTGDTITRPTASRAEAALPQPLGGRQRGQGDQLRYEDRDGVELRLGGEGDQHDPQHEVAARGPCHLGQERQRGREGQRHGEAVRAHLLGEHEHSAVGGHRRGGEQGDTSAEQAAGHQRGQRHRGDHGQGRRRPQHGRAGTEGRPRLQGEGVEPGVGLGVDAELGQRRPAPQRRGDAEPLVAGDRVGTEAEEHVDGTEHRDERGPEREAARGDRRRSGHGGRGAPAVGTGGHDVGPIGDGLGGRLHAGRSSSSESVSFTFSVAKGSWAEPASSRPGIDVR